MRPWLLLLPCWLMTATISCRAAAGPEAATATPEAAPDSAVLTGLDVLRGEGFARLQGRRVGLITNHTGIDRQGRQNLELMREAGVRLTAVFTPEHGLKGAVDQEYGSGTLEGLPVYSLYGQDRCPRAEWLNEVDILVFDIQDLGTRFYTYITTMALCLQAAAAEGKEFLVLDRPNPVNGLTVEGPVLEQALAGDFIAYYPIALRHGMTVGELARLFNAEFGIEARLEVVPLRHWRRGMFFDRTGLPWVNPSPNMRSLTAAILYPGLGIAESTNLSVGRGTALPFELYGAPYVDGARLAAELNRLGLPGVEFRDTAFVPEAYKFKGERCGGVRAVLTDREALRSVEAGLQLLATLKRLYPERYDLSGIDRWVGRREVKEQLTEGMAVEEIIAGWREPLESFLRLREQYLLYR